VQVNSDPKMRGRVISLFLMAVTLQPVGSLLIGAISQHIGAPDMLLCQGLAGLIIAGIFGRYLTSGKIAVA
jgi:hypothetical protein